MRRAIAGLGLLAAAAAVTGQDAAKPLKPIQPGIAAVSRLAFLPDNRLLISSDETDRRVILWDLQVNKEVVRFDLAGGDTPAVAAFPDGKRVLGFAGGPAGVVYDVDKRKAAQQLTGPPAGPRSVAVAPDGGTALLAAKDSLTVWNLKAGRPTQARGIKPSPARVAFAPTGKTAAYGADDGTVVVFDPKTLKPISEFKAHPKKGVGTLFFVPDGEAVVTTAVEDKSARVWAAKSGTAIRTMTGHGDNGVTAAAGSPGGGLLVTSAFDRVIKVWDVDGGKTVATVPSPVWPGAVAVSADGKTLAASDRDEPVVHLWLLPAK